MNIYEEARLHAMKGLYAAKLAHENEKWLSIENDLEQYEVLVSDSGVLPNTLLTFTLEFWSGWSDCAIHDWRFYQPLVKEDWPQLCSILQANLESNTEVTDEKIRKHFLVSPRKPMFSRLRSWFRG